MEAEINAYDLISTKEVISFKRMGINEELMTSSHITMESEKYIHVRQPDSSIVIIDMATLQQNSRLPVTADSTIINPTTDSIIAVKERKDGYLDYLKITRVKENNTIKSYQMAKKVIFWKWITPKLLGLITESSYPFRRTIYHWSIEGLSNPEKMFDMKDNSKIINYQCDPSEKWLAVSVADDKGHCQMQVFSVERQSAWWLYGSVGAFTTLKVGENNDISSTLLCSTGWPYTKMLSVRKLNAEGAEFMKCANIEVAESDFPLEIQISQKHGLIYLISKTGLLCVHDLVTALHLCKVKISEHPIILTTDATSSGGVYAINEKGQVLLTNVNDRFVLFASAKLMQSFNELFDKKKFMEAAQLAVDSPRGLRTPQTLTKFKSVPERAGQRHPLRLYFEALLSQGKLNAFESLELSRLIITQNEMDLFESWLHEDKLEYSKELGDLFKTVATGIAVKIYLKMGATQKVLDAFAEESIKLRASIEKERENRKKLEQVEQELFDTGAQLRITKELLEGEEKRRKETEDELARNKKDLQYRQKLQEEMLNEIVQLNRKYGKVQNKKGRIKEFGSSSKQLEPDYRNITYDEIKATTSNFDKIYVIGKGGNSLVYKAFCRGKLVAIKIVRDEGSQSNHEFNQEVKILSSVKHSNVVVLLGACPEARALVYELMLNGSLHYILSNQPNTLDWKMRVRIASNICSALIHLHSAKPHSIVHGDIKPSNILLDLNYTAKIGDFGICRTLSQTETRITPHHYTERGKGTLPYVDPEFLKTGELTSQYDVYSFGILLLELVTGSVTMGFRDKVADALKKGNQFSMDNSAQWPLKEAKKLIQLGIRCSDDTRANRPDLVKVSGEIKSLMDGASFRRN